MPATLPVPLEVVADLRRARRRQRVAAIHWVDALYQVYISGIGVIAVVGVLSAVIGDDKLSAAQEATYRSDAPALVGVAIALAVFIGLRSGSRGGPLAVEAADVRHVLLAPVDRRGALQGPALRQLRFLAFAGLGVGAACGQFAGRRFIDGGGPAWIGVGALLAVTIVGLGVGAALVASSRRLPPWAATVLGGALLGWAVGDVMSDGAPTSPTAVVGRMAVWPLHFDALALLGVLVALALVGLGLLGIAGVSLEAAERRTALVGQLRFAVTLQDLRTVLVLRRQLAADLPRSKPWIRAVRRPGAARLPVWQRGWRGVMRWPLPRVVRIVGVAALAGVATRAIWTGTTPMLVAAGVLMWIAALDAVEPLAQETDHPGRRDAYPVDEGTLMVRHLAVPTVVMLAVAGIAAGVAAALGRSTEASEVLAVSVLPMAFAATAGAVVSVLMGAPKPFDDLAIASPEIAGMRTVLRTIWPPLLACLGLLPVLISRNVANGTSGDPVRAAGTVGGVVFAVTVLTGGWVRYRADIRAWWAEASEAARNPSGANRDDDDDEDRR